MTVNVFVCPEVDTSVIRVYASGIYAVSSLEVVESTLDEGHEELTGVLPVGTASHEDHLVDRHASVDLEVVDGFRIGFVEAVFHHERTHVVVLGQFRNPVDDNGFEAVVEDDCTELAVGVDLVTESVRAVVTVIVVGLALVLDVRWFEFQELIDHIDEDLLSVGVVDVECGTVDSDLLTEFLDRDTFEGCVLQHL